MAIARSFETARLEAGALKLTLLASLVERNEEAEGGQRGDLRGRKSFQQKLLGEGRV